jgi:hypothetical protein
MWDSHAKEAAWTRLHVATAMTGEAWRGGCVPANNERRDERGKRTFGCTPPVSQAVVGLSDGGRNHLLD